MAGRSDLEEPVAFEDYTQLTFERRDHGVLLITIDRPEKYNAADEGSCAEVLWAAAWICGEYCRYVRAGAPRTAHR